MTDKGKTFDFDAIVEKDKARKRESARARKEITFREYLELLKEDPAIAQNSPARLFEIGASFGIEDIPEQERWLGVDKSYPMFSRHLFGVERPIAALMNYLKTGATRLSTGKQPIVFVGPPAGGKSTAVNILKQELEAYNARPIFAIKGCPKQEEPLHLLPRYLREEVEEWLGVKIEGDLCPRCRYHLMGKEKDKDGNEYYVGFEGKTFVDEDGTIRWEDFPVVNFSFSIQGSRGIGSFEPSDEKSQDVSELVGREIVGVSANPKYRPNHPLAWELSGEIEKGERGIVEAREIFKKGIDERILWVFINIAEEKELKVQGSSFPHISVDTVTIGHCNLEGFKAFSSDSGQEGLHNRFFIINFPYPLRVKDEVKIYQKLIQRESDFTNLRGFHIAPGALELAATFTILTRLVESNMGISKMDKMRAYNGELVLADVKDKDQKPIDLRALIEEGQRPDDLGKKEGMFGVSSRDTLAALNTAIIHESDRGGCLTPLKVIRALREVFEHRMGYTPEEVREFQLLLSVGEGGTVMQEYKDYILKMVSRAFLRAYDDLARGQFDKYIEEAKFVRAQSRKYARGAMTEIERDELSGKPKDIEVSKKFLKTVEVHVPGVSEAGADVFRGEILELMASDPEFGYETYLPLRDAVEKKLLSDAKASLTLILDPDRPKDEETKNRAADLFNELKRRDHCPVCAKEAVERAAEILSE